MSNPNITQMQLAASVATGITTAAALGGAGNLALNGSLVSGGVAILATTTSFATAATSSRRVGITSTGNDSGLTFTITGTNYCGNTISETLGGPNTATVQSVRDYATVTSIYASGASAGNISAGTTSVGSSPWIIDEFLATSWALAGGCSGPAGTTYSVEYTFDDPTDLGPSFAWQVDTYNGLDALSQVPPHTFVASGVSAVSGDTPFSLTPCYAHRLTVNSGTGLVTMWSIQAGSPRV